MVCELGCNANEKLARWREGSLGRSLSVQRHGSMKYFAACEIIHNLIGGLWFWRMWAVIPATLLIAYASLFYCVLFWNNCRFTGTCKDSTEISIHPSFSLFQWLHLTKLEYDSKTRNVRLIQHVYVSVSFSHMGGLAEPLLQSRDRLFPHQKDLPPATLSLSHRCGPSPVCCISMILSFWDCSVHRDLQHVTFWDWLVSSHHHTLRVHPGGWMYQ